MTRGFVLGKFMPPHAGHVSLCDAAMRLVDRLTILVCWLPDDPVPGSLRLGWMRELFPAANVVGHGDVVPQAPDEHPAFWPIWRGIVRRAHPEPIDLVFAGEAYGLQLAAEVGARFVPLGGRLPSGPERVPLSGSAVRARPWDHWAMLPPPVRAYYARTTCLHGPESVGKTTLAKRLADRFETIVAAEYGRTHCEIHGLELGEQDLLAIGRAQTATVAALRPWCNRRLIADTDALMTAAWSEMLLGRVPEPLLGQPRADLYLLLEPDVPWVDDGTRLFGSDTERARFRRASEKVLEAAGVDWVRLSGSWDERFDQAVAAIERLGPPV